MSFSGHAQVPVQAQQSRILILLDGSSSMVNKWEGNKDRFKAAGEIILKLIDSVYKVNKDVEFSLRVYGHQHTVPENDCEDTRNEVMFSKDNYTQMQFRLASLQPLGVTPIAYSLQQAAENDLVNEQMYAYSIVLVTDGGESCGGNICDVVKNLLQRKIYFKPYIVSLVDYAPLKEEYACLGKYLQVTRAADIPKTVGTIVDSFRPMLMLSKAEYKQIAASLANTPSALKVNIPVTKIPNESSKTYIIPKDSTPVKTPVKTEPKILPPPIVTKTDTAAKIAAPKPEEKKHIIKQTEVEETPALAKEKMDHIEHDRKIRPLPIAYLIETAPTREIPGFASISLNMPGNTGGQTNAGNTNPVTGAKPATNNPVTGSKPSINNPSSTATNNPVAGTNPSTKVNPSAGTNPSTTVNPSAGTNPSTTVNPSAGANPSSSTSSNPSAETKTGNTKTAGGNKPGTSSKPKKPSVPKVQKLTYTAQNIDASETTLEIYFTDAKREKFYYTTPMLTLSDASSGKVVKRFHRTVDASGNPDPQKDIPPGTYNLTIEGKSGEMRADKIVVDPKMRNAIYVRVNIGTLHFQYDTDPNKPVDEFTAIVVQRVESGGKQIKQKCSMDLEYEPGNYFIEVNTLPATRRNTDIEFGSQSIITIPEPGWVQFTNTNKMGKISLYTPLGDKFAKFYGMDINGTSSEAQKLKLQPGTYQAHFMKDPNIKFSNEAVMNFQVKSGQITEVELK